MPNSTLKQIIKDFLNEDSEASRNFFHGEASESDQNTSDGYSSEDNFTLRDQGIIFKLEDRYGGEGQGEGYWSVYSFTRGDEKVYLQFNGSYYSYSGADFDEFFFVEPAEKTITVFNRVKG